MKISAAAQVRATASQIFTFPWGSSHSLVRGLSASNLRSARRLNPMAALRAPTIATKIQKSARSVTEHVHRSLDKYSIPFRIDVIAHNPGHLGKIVDVDVVIDDDQYLGKHHLAQAPQSVHDLARLGRIFFLDRYDR